MGTQQRDFVGYQSSFRMNLRYNESFLEYCKKWSIIDIVRLFLFYFIGWYVTSWFVVSPNTRRIHVRRCYVFETYFLIWYSRVPLQWKCKTLQVIESEIKRFVLKNKDIIKCRLRGGGGLMTAGKTWASTYKCCPRLTIGPRVHVFLKLRI